MIGAEHDFLGWCVSCDKARKNTTHIRIGYSSGGRQIVRADIPSPKEADRLAALARKAERLAMSQAKMNKRDARIFALREQGLTWPEVAKKLKTTVPTVRHAYAKYERLGQEAATC